VTSLFGYLPERSIKLEFLIGASCYLEAIRAADRSGEHVAVVPPRTKRDFETQALALTETLRLSTSPAEGYLRAVRRQVDGF
jgi:hypothetical protein